MKSFILLLMLATLAMSFAPALPDAGAKYEYGAAVVGDYGIDASFAGEPAELPPVINKWPYGYRKAVTLTSSAAITVSPENSTLTFATLAIAHDATLTATVANSIVGDRIILKITADGTNRTLDFTGNLTAVDDSVVANKTKVFEFIYDGSKFVQLGELQIN